MENRLPELTPLKYAAVFGMPRSGTTWIAKTLDSSPRTTYLHEPDYVERVQCLPYTSDSSDWELWKPFTNDFIGRLPNLVTSRTALKRPSFPKAYESLPDLARKSLLNIALRMEQVTARLGMKTRTFQLPQFYQRSSALVWKSVEQTGNLGVWARSVPDQKIVYVVRHPCGYIDSVLRGERFFALQGGVPTSRDLGIFHHICRMPISRRLGLSFGDYEFMEPHERLAWIWLCINEQALEDVNAVSNCFTSYFDAFCLSPERFVDDMFDFLELPLESQTRNFLRRSTRTSSSSYYGMNRESALVPGSWANRLTTEQVESILAIVRNGELVSSLLQVSAVHNRTPANAVQRV